MWFSWMPFLRTYCTPTLLEQQQKNARWFCLLLAHCVYELCRTNSSQRPMCATNYTIVFVSLSLRFTSFFFYVLCVIFLVLVLFVVAFPRALHCCGVIHHIISVHTHTQFQTTMPIQHTHTHLQHTTRTHTYNIALPHTNTDTTPTNYS